MGSKDEREATDKLRTGLKTEFECEFSTPQQKVRKLHYKAIESNSEAKIKELRRSVSYVQTDFGGLCQVFSAK